MKQQRSLRVGLIGAGTMGRRHLEVLSGDPRVEIVGVADAVETSARDAAASVGARPCATPDQLADLGVDAAFVTLPNIYHGQVALHLLARGVHVFSEKPMATTLAEGRRIAERAKSSGRVYQMGFNRRWAPAYRHLKQAVESGFIAYSANVKINDGDMLTPAWYTNTQISGGFLYDTAIHLVDMIAWLIGRIERVAALGRQSCYPDYDDVALLLSCRGDRPVALTTCGHASWAAPQERVELYGDHALLVSEDLDRVRHTTREGPDAAWQHLPSSSSLAKWGYVDEDRAFVDACLGMVPPPVTADDALHSIAVLDAAYTSLHNGGLITCVPTK
jgi:myo-inositol 2-dehydrogenase / D-chiro-inositol 1-dehydrogenase